MDVFDVMRTARAIRRYRPDPVPDDVVRDCLEAATWAPSGSNRQAWRFVILRSPEARAVLGPAYRAGWEEKRKEFPLEPELRPGSGMARMVRELDDFVAAFEEVPVYVLFCLAGRGRPPVLGDGASIYPAVQNFLLAARAKGLGAVMTNWFLLAEDDLRRVVGIPDDWHLAALVPVGWPRGRHGPVRRRPVEEVTYVDRWGEGLA